VRISVYGSKQVVESLSNFIIEGENFLQPAGMKALVSLIQLMRHENLTIKYCIR
jgi:hypothetical protein